MRPTAPMMNCHTPCRAMAVAKMVVFWEDAVSFGANSEMIKEEKNWADRPRPIQAKVRPWSRK